MSKGRAEVWREIATDVVERIERGTQSLASGCQLVPLPARRSCDETERLKLSQPLGEHLLAERRHTFAEVAVSERSTFEVREEHGLPLAAEDDERELDRTPEALTALHDFPVADRPSGEQAPAYAPDGSWTMPPGALTVAPP